MRFPFSVVHLVRDLTAARLDEQRAIDKATELAVRLDQVTRQLARTIGERDRARGVLIAVSDRLDSETRAMIRGTLGTIEALP